MSKLLAVPPPPDQAERERALDATRSILVQAPAGSGKTDLLTRRFLRLLGEVDDPSHIVAITFTKAAAAEMRHRILSELERAADSSSDSEFADPFSMRSLAAHALQRSQALGWQIQDLPALLRISTIDSFCRELALQQPLISGFGSDLGISEQPEILYRRAARRTLQQIDSTERHLQTSVESLLLWRDNGWQEMEDLLVKMLGERDRWMHEFLLEREPDWNVLRERLQRPFAEAVKQTLTDICAHLGSDPAGCDEILELARFACEQSGGALHRELAEIAEFPAPIWQDAEALEDTRSCFMSLAQFLLTNEGGFRRQVNKTLGFPTEYKLEKDRMTLLVARLAAIEGLHTALMQLRSLPSARYSEDEWLIVKSCFMLLRHAAGELHAVFAEAGAVDFIEVAQIARRVLSDENGLPSDSAIKIADEIHHLLVDEFQDTSRRQHRLISHIAAAWPDQTDRTIFVVGDPLQSIYFFRDADAELFPQVREYGLEIPQNVPVVFDFVPLTANFRTDPALVEQLNSAFERIHSINDGSGITFTPAIPARKLSSLNLPRLELHIEFMPQSVHRNSRDRSDIDLRVAAQETQTAHTVALISRHLKRAENAQATGQKWRIAVLARTRKSLAVLAQALHEASIPFRSVDLEQLKDRPEILDALALARAAHNPLDRIAWLGILRAPWCGLSLADLHLLTSADDLSLLSRALPDILAEKLHLVNAESRFAVERVLNATAAARKAHSLQPNLQLGTWLQQLWVNLGGEACVDATAQANLDLLWSCLDALPNGAPDLLGPALDTALEKLKALPDPTVNSDYGVQLMTIHKSKGLEFEVVIIPDLQENSRASAPKLLSWLERGLPEPDESGEVTEFLVAPLQTKGTDKGKAKAWVDRTIRARESQELRRILYVAATRAREELHLFARAEYKTSRDGAVLMEPANSLLACAWPAISGEVQQRFEAWKQDQSESQLEQESVVRALAASDSSNLLVMPSRVKPTIVRRLPAAFEPPQSFSLASLPERANIVGAGDPRLYARHQGGLASRALGNAVHELLESVAHLRTTHDWAATRAALGTYKPRITAQVRSSGMTTAEAESIADNALSVVLGATHDSHAQWILSPHPQAASESAWTGVIGDALRSVRVDRVFRAGLVPLSNGETAWWIVDYKTAHTGNADSATALSELRQLFAPQLHIYASVLRNLHGDTIPLRAGLYYPRMSAFDWWEVDL